MDSQPASGGPGDFGLAYDKLRRATEAVRRIEREISGCCRVLEHFEDCDLDEEESSLFLDECDAVAEWVRNCSTSSGLPKLQDLRETLEGLCDSRRELQHSESRLRRCIDDMSRPYLRSLHILHMPEEILVNIFSFLDQPRLGPVDLWLRRTKDIGSVRLTCRRFCGASSHMLIHSVRLDCLNESVSHLEKIARHPTISKGIRSIQADLRSYLPTFSADFVAFLLHRISELQDRIFLAEEEQYWDYGGELELSGDAAVSMIARSREVLTSWLRLASDTPAGTLSLSEEEVLHRKLLEDTHHKYRMLYHEQESLRKDGGFCDAVAAAMAKMPCARTLELTDRDLPVLPKALVLGKQDKFYPFYRDLLQPISAYTASTCGFRLRLSDVLVALPAAIRKAGTLLENIDIRVTYLQDTSDLALDAEAQRQLSSVVQRLKSFTLQCENSASGNSEQLEGGKRGDNIRKFITPWLDTNTLESIHLDLMPTIDISGVLRSRPWPSLSRLFLQCVALDLADIRSLVKRLEQPLEELQLSNVVLANGTWLEVLDILHGKCSGCASIFELRGGECDDLTDAQYADVFDPAISWLAGSSKAERYICGFVSQNPLRFSSTI